MIVAGKRGGVRLAYASVALLALMIAAADAGAGTKRAQGIAHAAVSATPCGAVHFSWDAYPGTASYQVTRFRGAYPDLSAMTGLPTTTQPSIDDATAAASTTYSYQAIARDSKGMSLASTATVAFKTPGCAASGTLQKVGSLSGVGRARALAVDASTGVAVTAGSTGIHVVRLDPAKGPILASVPTTDYSPVGVTAQGGFAYAAQAVSSGSTMVVDLVTYDLRQPSAPVVLSRLRLPGASTGSGVAVDGSLVYTAATDAGLQIVDVSNRSTPRILASLPTGGISNKDVVLGGGFAYVNLGDQLAVADVRKPTSPVLDATLRWGQTWAAWSEGLLYRWSNLSLRIYDVTTPATPRWLKDFVFANTQTVALDAALIGGRAFVGTNLGLSVLDLSKPAAPLELSQTPSSVPIEHVRGTDAGLLVTVDQSGNLTLYSVAP